MMKRGLGVLAVLAMALFLTGVARASPILDVNVVEFIYEDNNWNGFCYNCAGTSGDTNAYGANVFGNLNDSNGILTIKNTSSTTNLSDVVVYISQASETFGWGTAACTNASVINFWDSDSSDGNVIIHIRDLPSGTSIDCNYDINNQIAVPPLVITEDYNFRTIVLTQRNTIVVNLANQDTARYPNIRNVSITKTAFDYNNNGRYDFNFSNCQGLDGLDANFIFTNCNPATVASSFTWDLNGVDLNADHGTPASPIRMQFVAQEVDFNDHNNTGFFPMGVINAQFTTTSILTDLNVWKITAIAPASLQVYKRQDPDGNNGSSYDGYDWGFNLSFTNNTTDVNFNITKMSMWITIFDSNTADFNGAGSTDPAGYLNWHDFRNPNQAIDVNKLFNTGHNYTVMPVAGANSTCTFAHDKNRLECTANPATYKLGPAQVWYATHGENIDSNGWWIDKNLAANPYQPDGNTPWVPVVWGDANFTIASDEYDFNRGIRQYSYSFTELIYIIHDYIISARKDVTRVAPNDYNIFLFVHNRGTKNTPQNVYVYDVIPSGFDRNANYPWAITRARGGTDLNAAVGDGNQAIYATSSNDINGIAYWINVGPLDANNASTTDEATVNYRVTGSGDYNAIDLFIVGVDPIQTDGPNVHGTPVARLAFLATQFTEEESTIGPIVGIVLAMGLVGGAISALKP